MYLTTAPVRLCKVRSCQLKAEDLEDLTAVSRWLDLKTVAVRALRIHGGLRRHNEMYVSLPDTRAEPCSLY